MSNIEKTLQQIIYSLNDVHVGIHLLSKQLVMNSEQVQFGEFIKIFRENTKAISKGEEK